MTGTKTVAERLREKHANLTGDDCWVFPEAVGKKCGDFKDCQTCVEYVLNALADMIEAEQASAVSKALKGAKPQLPEGVIWPTYEDGELVKPFDKLPGFDSGGVQKFIWTSSHNGAWQLQDAEGHMLNVMHGEPVKRPEPAVLDADGVLIEVGDTVWHEDEGECVVERIYRQNGDTLLDLNVCGAVWNIANVKPAEVTHRKPDTQEAIDADAAKSPCRYFGAEKANRCSECPQGTDDDVDYGRCRTAMTLDLLERQRKLLGGE